VGGRYTPRATGARCTRTSGGASGLVASTREAIRRALQDRGRRLNFSRALVYALFWARKIRHEPHGTGPGMIRIDEEAVDKYRRVASVSLVGLSVAGLGHITST
jgi:hypothetical protein